MGAPLAWFIPDRFRSAHARHVDDFGATGVTSRRMAGARVVMGLRRNGEEFPIDASISQLTDGTSRFYTVVLRDVSERMRALESLARSKEELRELASAASSAREQEQSRIARELPVGTEDQNLDHREIIGWRSSTLQGAFSARSFRGPPSAADPLPG